jgi:hypothetical protein
MDTPAPRNADDSSRVAGVTRLTFDHSRWMALASRALTILVWLMLAALVFWIATHERNFQWDFRVFYNAPDALKTGANPYFTGEAGGPQFSYLYPPLVIHLFRPLNELPFGTAYLLWLAAKLVAIGLLARLWHRHFETLSLSWPTVLFIAFGFNTAVLRDLSAGNIATFELLGLWVAFSLLLRNRCYSAAVVIAVVAQFKLIPIAFAILLLFVGPPGRWRPFLVCLGTFVLLLSLNFVFMPEMTQQYLQSFSLPNPNLDERGTSNPSSLSLIRDLTDMVSRAGVALPAAAPTVIFLAYVAGLASLMLWLVRRYVSRWLNPDPRWWIYFACVLYVLAMPRIKDYAFSILLIPALFVIRRFRSAALVPLVAVFVLLPSRSTFVPGLGFLISFVQSYLSWIAAWVLLFFLLRHLFDALEAQNAPRVQADVTLQAGSPA